MSSDRKTEEEIRYLRFVDETLRARELVKVHEAFSRKVFDYLENDPRFGAQEFVVLLVFYLEKITEVCGTGIAKNSVKHHALETFPSLFKKSAFSINANIWEIDPMFEFYKEKLKHTAKIEYPYKENVPDSLFVSFTFTMPRPSAAQFFDVLHFLLCALNYKALQNPALKHAIDIFSYARYELILEATREKEDSENYERALFARLNDVEAEKQWADENSSVFVKSEAEIKEINFDEKVENSLTKRQWLIAMSFFVDSFKLHSIGKTNFSRLLTVMNNGKNYQDFRAKFDARDLITTRTANDAQRIADLFREFDLPDVAADIENNINKLKL